MINIAKAKIYGIDLNYFPALKEENDKYMKQIHHKRRHKGARSKLKKVISNMNSPVADKNASLEQSQNRKRIDD